MFSFLNIKTLQNAMAATAVIAFFACENNYREIQQLGQSDYAPVAEGKEINLKYTDSGRLTANLLTPTLWDYSNFSFNYNEFPDGLEVHFWDEEDRKTIVKADYGVQYEKTSLIDLRENVVLITHDSLELYAQQLYWNQENQWVFTDQPYKIKFQDGSFNEGSGFDSNEDFTTFLSRKNIGVQFIEDTPSNTPDEDEQNTL